MILQVAVVGGTHGNEWTGVHLLRHWQQRPRCVERSSFQTQLLLANPEAIEKKSRFVDKDLNRCFSFKDLLDTENQSLEVQRAQEINKLLGPKGGHGQCDLLIDMHSSTSHCGAMIILTHTGDFNLRLAAYLLQQEPTAKVVLFPFEGGDSPYMGSLSESAVGVEVGPVAQNVLQHEALALTERLVHHALDFVEISNCGRDFPLAENLPVLRFKSSIKYPARDGVISAVVHRAFQSTDYTPLLKGQPLFYSFDGQVENYCGEEGLIPIFINEAAYYAEGIAAMLTEQLVLTVPKIK